MNNDDLYIDAPPGNEAAISSMMIDYEEQIRRERIVDTLVKHGHGNLWNTVVTPETVVAIASVLEKYIVEGDKKED